MKDKPKLSAEILKTPITLDGQQNLPRLFQPEPKSSDEDHGQSGVSR